MPGLNDDLEAIARDLAASPLDEFTAKRNDRVKELRAAGRRELAAEVRKLHRPSVAVWTANQLAKNSNALTGVHDAVVAATEAQTRGCG